MFFTILVLFAVLAVQATTQTADLVVVGARIYTLDPARPEASAIAVKGDRILGVGDDVSRHIGSDTHRIEAGGATIIPGFIDCHVHMEGLGDALENLDFRSVRSIEEVAAMVGKAASERKPGEWVRGRNWDQTNWGGQFPTAEPLSSAAPSHPVYLTRVDGHAAWVNKKALEIAGVTRSTPDPPGGRILRNASGTPTGVLIDRAQGLVSSEIPSSTDEEVRRRLARAARECARLGLTTVHDAGVSSQQTAAYRELIQEQQLPVRVYAMIGGEGPLWRRYLERGPEIGERLTIRSIKLMADGAMGSRGAAFWEAYSDDPGNSGLLMLTKEDVERVAREALRQGFQVNTHAIGDRANHIVLDAYGAVLGGKNDRRFRVEHAQAVALEDFELFAKYSVIASMQATHATSDMRWAEARVGPKRVKGAYAWRRFLSAGVPVANGSDFPVEEPNPLRGFYAAITRQDHQGKPEGGWFPDQRMTREEALKSWTLTGAYAAFEEEAKGSLVAGKLADFVMLSKDIMRVPPPEILQTRVLMTVLGGKSVYSELP
jgi:predicted amidohydrolase YtcJ